MVTTVIRSKNVTELAGRVYVSYFATSDSEPWYLTGAGGALLQGGFVIFTCFNDGVPVTISFSVTSEGTVFESKGLIPVSLNQAENIYPLDEDSLYQFLLNLGIPNAELDAFWPI
jgi:hypothetical protein